MNGQQFYLFLSNLYLNNGEPLYGNYSFKSWLQKNDGTRSFQFNLLNSRKSIPKNWIVEAKDAQNNGEVIDRQWFSQFGKHANDCRASVMMHLLQQHN